VFSFAKPESWHTPEATTTTDTTRYGTAEARSWDRMHPRLTCCRAAQAVVEYPVTAIA
jgi:hypothetical protein